MPPQPKVIYRRPDPSEQVHYHLVGAGDAPGYWTSLSELRQGKFILHPTPGFPHGKPVTVVSINWATSKIPTAKEVGQLQKLAQGGAGPELVARLKSMGEDRTS